MINHAKLKQRVWFLGDPNYLDCGETPYIASGLITDLRGEYADYEITTDDGELYDRDADELYSTKEALEKVFFLYNDWREEVKLPSGKMPPKLSSRQVVRLTLELDKNKKATLKSPKSWDRQFVWVVQKI